MVSTYLCSEFDFLLKCDFVPAPSLSPASSFVWLLAGTNLVKMDSVGSQLQAPVPVAVDSRRVFSSSSGTSPEIEEFGNTTDAMGYVDPKSLGSDPSTGFLGFAELQDTPGFWQQQHISYEACLVGGPTHDWGVEGTYNLSCSSVGFLALGR
jgi:hypothetical protein